MSFFSSMGSVVSEGVRMPIVYPGHVDPVREKLADGGVGEAGYLELLSLDSEVGQRLTKEASERLRQQMSQPALLGGRDDDPERRNVEMLASLTTGWRLIDPNGKLIEAPFTRDAAIELYSAPEMKWLFRRAFAFVQADANFMKRSS